MNRTLLAISGLVAVSIFLVSAGTLITQPNDKAFPEKEVSIALRQVGHSVLLQAGDSVSRVLPVKKVDAATYRLEFQSPFAFVPDSLVKAVRQSIELVGVPLSYTVHVLSCSSDNDIVYGFQIGLQQQTTLVPCLGRTQPVGCYVILLSFQRTEKAEAKPLYLTVLALASLIMATFIWNSYSRKKAIPEEKEVAVAVAVASEGKEITIGQYTLYPDRRVLKLGQSVTDLSDKEVQLLTLFATNLNQPVTRDQLMKEVWQDDGVLISRSLDVFVSRLRKKLKNDSSLQLMNIHGMGYKMVQHSPGV